MKNLPSILKQLRAPSERAYRPSLAELLALLRAQSDDCAALYATADDLRRQTVGDDVHVRGIVEFSNYCTNDCGYCGIRRGSNVTRYRMTPEEIVAQAAQARAWGCNTVVLQSGEDPWFTAETLCDIVRAIRQAGMPAITLSVGVRPSEELRKFAAAGCDRYLLRFETSNRRLFHRIHPDATFARRIQCLKNLRAAGIQVGSGFMIGLPDTPLATLARDILFATQLAAARSSRTPTRRSAANRCSRTVKSTSRPWPCCACSTPGRTFPPRPPSMRWRRTGATACCRSARTSSCPT